MLQINILWLVTFTLLICSSATYAQQPCPEFHVEEYFSEDDTTLNLKWNSSHQKKITKKHRFKNIEYKYSNKIPMSDATNIFKFLKNSPTIHLTRPFILLTIPEKPYHGYTYIPEKNDRTYSIYFLGLDSCERIEWHSNLILIRNENISFIRFETYSCGECETFTPK